MRTSSPPRPLPRGSRPPRRRRSRSAYRWQSLRRLALDFLARPVALEAARNGWCAEVLFGVVVGHDGDLNDVGVVFALASEGEVFAFDADACRVRHPHGDWHSRSVADFDPCGAVPLWDVAAAFLNSPETDHERIP